MTACLRPRRGILAAVFACAAVVHGPQALASPTLGYPEKPVRMIVPYPPGGATDVIGRVLARHLSERLGQQIVVENRAGAGGSVGAGQVAKSPADGYTLLMGAMTSHSINAALQPRSVPYDIQRSFVPIAIVGSVPLVFVVHPAVPAHSLAELIALARSKPNSLTFASGGIGSPQHLAAEMFKRMVGVEVLHVPYKGSGPAMTDLVGGQVHAMIETAPAAHAHVRAGKLRALATTTAEPVPSLPGVPTSAEAGLAGFEVRSIFGLAAPAGTAADIVSKLKATLRDILSQQEVKDALLAQGVLAAYTTPEQAAQAIAAEYEKWAKVIRDGNITVD
ncbi:MAG TPA: tripartite tricarboxylate transporter substrate binding protein [Burkholderiaceae bacterium]|nr:tripartite tricarboxylate transporter substrate binding protein [Burkholderiaceae bacterium]